MMRSEFGTRVRVCVFGESHGKEIGGSVCGIPAGIPTDGLAPFLERRKGGSALSTPRREEDAPVFLSGIRDGKTDGTEIRFTLPNRDVKPDAFDFGRFPRPSHADYPAGVKYPSADLSGGGHFSGRLTAPLCVCGYFAKEALRLRGISVGARLVRVGNATAAGFDPSGVTADELERAGCAAIPSAMEKEILAARQDGDSVGGEVQCAAVGLPAGLGDPLYGGVENRLSAALFGLGGVRGVSFGDGFAAAAMRGSEHNDPYTVKNGRVETESNHAGGVLGGMTTGMPLCLRVGFKPTPSIAKPQQTVDLASMTTVTVRNNGRHDPCIALRATVCVEAVTALVLLDLAAETERGIAGIRAEIDGINREMRELFLRRMALSKAVGEEKRKRGLALRDEAREHAILCEMERDVPEAMRPYVARFFEELMAQSRTYQEEET